MRKTIALQNRNECVAIVVIDEIFLGKVLPFCVDVQQARVMCLNQHVRWIKSLSMLDTFGETHRNKWGINEDSDRK